jgi:ArsR family transcriptional regulator
MKGTDGRLHRRLFELQAQLCAALADPTRLEILHLLKDGERTVADLMAALGQRQNNVSQHLAYLRRVGAVAGERRGSHVYYRVAMPGLVEACESVRQALLRQLAAQADEAASLARALEVPAALPGEPASPATAGLLRAVGPVGEVRSRPGAGRPEGTRR